MAHTQDTRMCKLTPPEGFGANDLLVGRLSATEAISRLFQIELDLLSPKPDIPPGRLLGQPLQVSIELDNGRRRFFHGLVSRVSQGETEGRLFVYRVEVVPWLWMLSRNVDCRIFQNQTVPQILETVFTDHGFKGLFDITAPGLSTPREYCVQYRESDLNFVSRLMEEEGLFYFFLHEEKKHTLIVSDGSRKLPEHEPKQVSIRPGSSGGREIENWFAERELHSGTFGNADWNVEERKVISSLELTSVAIADNANFEVFDFPSEQTKIADSDRRAQLRMQTEEASAARHSATGSMPGFAAGHVFELTDHFHEILNQPYMLTTVHHSVAQEITSGGSSTYFNSFSAVRVSTSFRPPLVTPKPIVQGPQTALVVGKDDRGKIDPAQADDDIDVDELGRVLVKFHWDRSGPNAKRESQQKHESSCRARVSQDWAGRNWGAVFWPRIGQEVIVEFIEGDPDHPLITGSVYNGKFKPPYDLPANKTQSGIKTRSTPNGTAENFNEIRFEDKKGSEEINIHAERNLSTSVEADESRSVGGSRSTTVQKDESLTIKKGSATLSVEGTNRSVYVKEQYLLNAKSIVAQSTAQHIHVIGEQYVTVACKQSGVQVYPAYVSVGTGQMANHATWDSGGITVHGVPKVVIDAGGSQIEVTAGGIKITSPAIVEVKGSLVKLNC